MKLQNRLLSLCFMFLVVALPLKTWAQSNVPTPKSHFGFNIGDDYHLANFTQTEAYFKKLAASSDRVKLVDIGETEEGRRQYMLIVSSPENMKKLDHYKEISQKMARAEISEQEARKLAKEGKAVVWIDGGLHASETVGMQQLIETAYQLASRTDDETLSLLDKTIVLLVHANPDGQELISNWYMRESDPTKRSLSGVPTMYQKYVGHDNNRDFFMLNMKESQNIGRQLFVEWIPQIMYNHHQTAPAGAVVAGAPYRDPHNYVFDPILMTSIDALGAAMHTRLNAEGKPGYTQRGGSVFSTWYNGGLRTTTYFHNIVGLLTETIGGPNPYQIPLVPNRLLPNGDTPNPVLPQIWHFRQSIDYSVTMNYAVIDHAARNSDKVLYNIYRMGRNSIEKGSTDTWSFSPSKIELVEKAIQDAQERARQQAAAGGQRQGAAPAAFAGRGGASPELLKEVTTNPAYRDPRGYVIPVDQADFPTAVKFLNALIRTGIVVHRATADFTVAGKSYKKGSYIVKTNQAFRPHVLDMFEPQDHPNDFQYPGGPPIAPYDAAGWTPAFLMNVKFDRYQDDFTGPFERLPDGELLPVPESVLPSAKFFVLSAQANDSYKVVNNLLSKGVTVSRAASNGDFYVEATAKAKTELTSLVKETGVKVNGASSKPQSVAVKPSRIALWDTYGGSMPSGWVRWIMEQYNYDMNLIFAQEIDKGNLIDKYDVIVFVSGAIPGVSQGGGAGFGGGRNQSMANIPAEHQFRVGRITAEQSIPALKEFLEKGGRIVTIGSSANLAYHLNLPVRNAMVELVNGREVPLSNDKYYTPGSVLNAKVATNSAANWGMEEYVNIYFDRSPVFKLTAEGMATNVVKPLMWFDSATPLRSGWSWGQAYLKDGVTAFEANVGKGKLYVFGPEITFRAQAHGTFKLLFNQLYNN